MANRKISDLTALTAPAAGDLLPIVDISEAVAADKNKNITYGELLASAPAGSAAAPSFSFDGDPNSGLYSAGADQVAITTGGTARLTTSTTAVTSTLPIAHPLGAVGTPSITFTGDLNTGVFSPGADQIAITTGGTGRLFIDSSGRLLAGTSTARSNFFGTTLSSVAQIEGTGGALGRGALSVINNDVSNNPPYVLLGRSGAASLSSNAAVVNGSRLGTLTFHGADGTSFIEAATVAGEVDGTPGTNDMPGRLVFSTTLDGAASPTERMRIDSLGRLLVGTMSSSFSLTAAFQGNSGNTAGAAVIHLRRGEAAATITSAEILGVIRGTDNADNSGAEIQFVADGTWGASDYPTRITFSTAPDGSATNTERLRITNDGVIAHDQPAPAAVNATATLTIANLKAGIITSTSAAATDMTLPTGTDTQAGFFETYDNFTFEWSVINTGPSLVRVLAGTAHTVVGSGSVATGTSGRFASRRTAANTFVSYRLA